MTPKEWTEKTVKDIAENKKKREREIKQYEADKLNKSIAFQNNTRYRKRVGRML